MRNRCSSSSSSGGGGGWSEDDTVDDVECLTLAASTASVIASTRTHAIPRHVTGSQARSHTFCYKSQLTQTDPRECATRGVTPIARLGLHKGGRGSV